MAPICCLVGTIVFNYLRHRNGWGPTICATTRRLLPKPVATALVVGIFAWLLPHVRRGYLPRP